MKGYVFFGLLLFSINVMAQSTDVSPSGNSDFSDVNYPGRAMDSLKRGFQIQLDVKCYGANLRSIANPIGQNSTVTMNVKFKSSVQPEYKTLHLSFPSKLASRISGQCQWVNCVSNGKCCDQSSQVNNFLYTSNNTANIDPNISNGTLNNFVSLKDANYNPVPNVNVGAFGSSVRAYMPDVSYDGASMDAEGNISTESRESQFESVDFVQSNVTNSGAYTAQNGALAGSVKHSFTNDGRTLKISAAFPGEYGYCGGYFSPLGLVFEKGLANIKIDNKSVFKVRDMATNFYWPNKDNIIFFLAKDNNKDGKINDGSELFGDWSSDANGFESLKKFDDNKDGVINSKDKVFTSLLLWNDKNGDGVSDKNEIMKLGDKKVTEISVNYSSKDEYTFGNRATIRQQAGFKYKDAVGKSAEGVVYDFWFSPVLDERKLSTAQ